MGQVKKEKGQKKEKKKETAKEQKEEFIENEKKGFKKRADIKKRFRGKGTKDMAVICYGDYHFVIKEWLGYGAIYFVGVTIFGYLFYNTIWFSVIMIPFLFPYYKMVKKREEKKRLERLKVEFKDALTALTASLHTGYAIENAFREAYAELMLLHGKDALIVREFDYMLKQMRISRTVEEVVEEFAVRSGLEDIQNFSQVFSMANRSGGKLTSIMDAAAETIGQKIDVEREILTMIQGKKLEQRIMSVVPVAMIAYLRLGNSAFMRVLYESMAGRAVMTGCLIGYLVALWIGEKIMEIKI